jgi:hypothetical protein
MSEADTLCEDVVVYLDAETRAAIEAQLEYGDSMSGWIRDAVELRLDREE